MMICITSSNGLLCLMIFGLLANMNVYSDNWRASLISSLQMDNQFSPEREYSAEAQFNYAYDNAELDWHSRINFLMRSSEQFYQRGKSLYEFSFEKGLASYHSRFRMGRLQRSDNLGFYFLDGIQLNYTHPKEHWQLELYAGKPGRIDDVESINGDSLWGVDWSRHFKFSGENEFLPLKIINIDLRSGFQRLKSRYINNRSTANRFNLAINQEAQYSGCKKDCLGIKNQFLFSYDLTHQDFDDLIADLRVPINKAIRVRFSYQYYKPELKQNPGFREQFFSYYSLGSQKLTRTELNYRFNPRLSGFVEIIHSKRQVGNSGHGIHSGIEINHLLQDLDVSLAMDSFKLGKEGLASFYFSIQYHLNSRLKMQWDAIFRREDKYPRKENRVKGIHGKFDYMLKNNLLLSLQLKSVHYSRLRNEYLVRFGLSYFFDNFKAKQHKQMISMGELSHAME